MVVSRILLLFLCAAPLFQISAFVHGFPQLSWAHSVKTLPKTRMAANAAPGDNPQRTRLAEPGRSFAQSKARFFEAAVRANAMVTSETRARYDRDGVVVVKAVISEMWISLLRDACVTAQDKSGPFTEWLQQPEDAGVYFTDLELARRLPDFAAFALYGPCAAVAAALMSSHSARFLYDQLFVKEHGVSVPTFWHQDAAYWKVQGQQITSAFVPLDFVAPEDGLAFVAGSHNWPLHNPQNFADGTPYSGTGLPSMPDVDVGLAAGEMAVLRFRLEPGDVLMFSGSIVHGGKGNWGRALSTRWVGDDVTYSSNPNVMVPTGVVGLRDGEPFASNDAAFPAVWPPE